MEPLATVTRVYWRHAFARKFQIVPNLRIVNGTRTRFASSSPRVLAITECTVFEHAAVEYLGHALFQLCT